MGMWVEMRKHTCYGCRLRIWSDDTHYTGKSITVVLRHYQFPLSCPSLASSFCLALYIIPLLRLRPGAVSQAHDTCWDGLWLNVRTKQIELEFFVIVPSYRNHPRGLTFKHNCPSKTPLRWDPSVRSLTRIRSGATFKHPPSCITTAHEPKEDFATLNDSTEPWCCFMGTAAHCVSV